MENSSSDRRTTIEQPFHSSPVWRLFFLCQSLYNSWRHDFEIEAFLFFSLSFFVSLSLKSAYTIFLLGVPSLKWPSPSKLVIQTVLYKIVTS